MSIKIDMTSTDVDRQIALLKFYPEVVERHYRSLLETDVDLLYNEIAPNIPQGATGKARATFKSRVTGTGINLQGQVGWWGRNTAWYIKFPEDGTAPHQINSYAPGLGVFVKEHPGMSAVGFMAAGYSAIQPIIEVGLQKAGEDVLREMEIK